MGDGSDGFSSPSEISVSAFKAAKTQKLADQVAGCVQNLPNADSARHQTEPRYSLASRPSDLRNRKKLTHTKSNVLHLQKNKTNPRT